LIHRSKERLPRLIGVIPNWPHSSGWGYYPAGGIGTILIIVLILLLLGRL
jgi:hypothetical protein